MATISLTLFKTKSKVDAAGTYPIYIRYSNGANDRALFYTGERCKPGQWNAALQKVQKHLDDAEINRKLAGLTSSLENYVRSLQYEKQAPTAKLIKIAAEELLRPGKKINSHNIFEVLKDFVETNPQKLKHGTLHKYKALLRRLTEFSDIGHHVSFQGLNKEFTDSFTDFLTNTIGNTNDTIVKHFNGLRAFVKWCNEVKGLKIDIKPLRLQMKERGRTPIFLDYEELLILYNFNFSEGLTPSIDLFCFACLTGMRHSDAIKVSKANISGDFIIIKQVKTGDTAKIPINKYSLELLKKYHYKMPVISDQKCNENIKRACALAGINMMVEQVRFRGNERLEKHLPKNQLITFHSARATFIIHLLRKGISAELVMKMTGHIDYKSFQKYINFSEKMLLEASAIAWD